MGHALLTTTQLYLTPRKEDVIRRVLAHHSEQVRQARDRARPADRTEGTFGFTGAGLAPAVSGDKLARNS